MRSPLRVVVADDEYDVRLLLRMQLSALDDVELVGEAGDGYKCIDLCRDLQPQAVVMDLLMPRLDGFAAIDHLRREQPDIGIVAYTAVAGDYVRQEMGRLGIQVVLKSGDVSVLAEALRHSVSGRDAPRAPRPS